MSVTLAADRGIPLMTLPALLLVSGAGLLSTATASSGPSLVTRAALAPGLRVRLDEKRQPPAVVVLGRRGRLTFERFFSDPAVFTPKELNENRYQTGRGLWQPTAYHFFGLAKYRGQVYVGVNWYSPTASAQPSAYCVIFRLGWKNGHVTATPFKKLPETASYSFGTVPTSVLLDHLRSEERGENSWLRGREHLPRPLLPRTFAISRGLCSRRAPASPP